MPVSRLKHFLDSHGVRYETIRHPPAYTASETAQTSRVAGKEFAKTLVVKLDGRLAMAVLPASEKLNLKLLKRAAGAAKAELAGEDEFKDKFPGCEIGAMPPFGNLYGMEVFASETLAADREIAFNAGSHTEIVRMAYEDYARLVQPRLAKLASTAAT